MAEKIATIPVASGAEAFLEQIRALGVVRYLFANTGTDHGPIIEALATEFLAAPTKTLGDLTGEAPGQD